MLFINITVIVIIFSTVGVRKYYICPSGKKLSHWLEHFENTLAHASRVNSLKCPVYHFSVFSSEPSAPVSRCPLGILLELRPRHLKKNSGFPMRSGTANNTPLGPCPTVIQKKLRSSLLSGFKHLNHSMFFFFYPENRNPFTVSH